MFFLNTKNYKTTYLQIIEDEVVFDKKNIITCLPDLMRIISDEHHLEYEKYPRLNQWILRIEKDLNSIKDTKDFGRFLEEISNSLVEARINGIEETKIKHKIKKSIC